MARIRTIKPEFWADGAIIECSTNARLLFVGTWTFADDLGNLDRSAKQIKAQVFPADDFDCEPLIQELLIRGLLVEYSLNGKKYLHIHSFTKHQKIDRPGPPRCPIFEDSSNTQRTIVEHSTTIRPRKGREGKGDVKEKEKTTSMHRSTAKKNGEPNPTLQTLIDLGTDPQAAADWLTVRKAKRAPLTQSVIDSMQRESGKAGITLGAAIAICAKRSWQGFDASWDWRESAPKKTLMQLMDEDKEPPPPAKHSRSEPF